MRRLLIGCVLGALAVSLSACGGSSGDSASEQTWVDAVREDQPIERIGPEQLRVEACRRTIEGGRARRRQWRRGWAGGRRWRF